MALPYTSPTVIETDDLVLGGAPNSPANKPHTELQANIEYVYSLLSDDLTYGSPMEYFKVIPSETSAQSGDPLYVDIKPGRVQWGSVIVEVSDTITMSAAINSGATSASSRVDLIYMVSSAGNIAISANTITSAFDYSAVLPLAHLTISSAVSAITTSQIGDIRPFLKYAIASSGGAATQLHSASHSPGGTDDISDTYIAKDNGTVSANSIVTTASAGVATRYMVDFFLDALQSTSAANPRVYESAWTSISINATKSFTHGLKDASGTAVKPRIVLVYISDTSNGTTFEAGQWYHIPDWGMVGVVPLGISTTKISVKAGNRYVTNDYFSNYGWKTSGYIKVIAIA